MRLAVKVEVGRKEDINLPVILRLMIKVRRTG